MPVLGYPKANIKAQKWNCNSFYKENPNFKLPPPSDKAEQAFNLIRDWFLHHQKMLFEDEEIINRELQKEKKVVRDLESGYDSD